MLIQEYITNISQKYCLADVSVNLYSSALNSLEITVHEPVQDMMYDVWVYLLIG